MLSDVDRYIRNYYFYGRINIFRNKISGFLKPLPIPDYAWQYITMDFKSMPVDKKGYDIVFVVINRLSKQAISLSYYKIIISENMARFYISAIYRYKGPPESIILDRGPQFVSSF
jgi:hypothetical protein